MTETELTVKERQLMMKITKGLAEECKQKNLDLEQTQTIVLECLRVMAEELISTRHRG